MFFVEKNGGTSDKTRRNQGKRNQGKRNQGKLSVGDDLLDVNLNPLFNRLSLCLVILQATKEDSASKSLKRLSCSSRALTTSAFFQS
jgi:hypothetical protein